MTAFLSTLRLRRRRLAGLLLLLFLPSCNSWQVAQPTPAAYLQNERPASARVTRTDGTRLVVRTPSLAVDTLQATSDDGKATAVAVPLDKVARLEVRKFSAGRTLLLVGGIIAAVSTIAAASLDYGFGGGFNLGSPTRPPAAP
ncbi:MAG TPA: hypothetical protein VFU45_03050 [Gemmatimonadales bacterium]|nr:hypothetical protein [Gemmatimonadales bacterium]